LKEDVMRRLLLALSLLPVGPVLMAWSCLHRSATTADLPVSVVRVADVRGPAPAAPGPKPAYDEPGFRKGEAPLTPAEKAGREIWYKATAGNGRFHTYVFQQRLGVLIDWYRVLAAKGRDDRFRAWGLINDPDCCMPGTPGCKATSLDETYGFDYCVGDDDLLKYVGKAGYRDPACDFQDAEGLGSRQDPCDLAFGTSTGALGLRKFPNPRFDKERWRQLNGGDVASWDGYNRKLEDRPGVRVSHLMDGSVEPPFYIGMACGACHIAFHPAKPPKDPAHPEWDNIIGAIGNQYARFSEIMASGMAPDSPEWQIFTHARPGTVDTSAVPNDQVHNPGTMNAVLNLPRRPTFAEEKILKWRPAASCPAGADEESCWCEPGKSGKCWKKSTELESVHHILKGGEDSIGAREAVQRVYFNIGSCSEECWVNHLTDLRQIDPQQRGFGQTPFDIGQCRRDCPNFRAIEDRLGDIVSFLMSSETRASDLAEARGVSAVDLVEQLEKEYGDGAVEKGRTLFAQNCARCHSTQKPPFENVDFGAADATPFRVDWLGNDQSTPVSEVGTYTCRALHSNHMEGHVWQEYGSDTLRSRPADSSLGHRSDGGRGYYRNISLVNAWAHAPFMHNNALGPEICGQPKNPENDFYRSPYVDDTGAAVAAKDKVACVPYDPSVKGRYELFKASMESLLNPKDRVPKVSRLDEPIRLEVGLRLPKEEDPREKELLGVRLEFREGIPASFFGNFQHKAFFVDLVEAKTRPEKLKARLGERYGAEKAEAWTKELQQVSDEVLKNPGRLAEIARPRLPLLKELYLSCAAEVENEGHRFGESLSAGDKKALIAFLATL
jgi:hypothetical protein